jgi:hypothetical protein
MITRQRVVFAALVAWAALVSLATLRSGAPDEAVRSIALGGAGVVFVIALLGLLAGAWRGPLLAALGVTATGLAVCGLLAHDGSATSAGILGLIIVGGAAAVVYQFDEQALRLGKGPRDGARSSRTEELLEKLHEHSMLSDTAKRVLFRDRELDLLRNVIEGDIGRGEYNAALRLCDDMANVFGYREEAEAFRTRINRARHEDYQAQVHAAIEQLNGHLVERDWPRAHEVAARMRRLFPDQHVVEDVEARINRARAEHKEELQRAFLDAAHREDVELAMEKLRQLDHYLTPEETEALQNVAQEVVAKHRSNLSVRFKLAVNDHRWVDAARIGDTIIAEFPNTKMAEEVRTMIDVLRTRASQAAVAAGELRS